MNTTSRIKPQRSIAVIAAMALAGGLGLAGSAAATAAGDLGKGAEWHRTPINADVYTLKNGQPDKVKAGLMGLDTDRDGNTDTYVYCIEHDVPVSNVMESRREYYYAYDWDTYRSSAPNWEKNKTQVAWILANSYPQVDAADFRAKTGVRADLPQTQIAAAVQSAVWHLTDGVEFDWTQQGDFDRAERKKIYDYLIEGAKSATVNAPLNVGFSGAPITGQAGSLVGPIKLKGTTAATVNLVPAEGKTAVPAGVTLVDKQGNPISGQVAVDSDLYVQVPAGTAPGSVLINAEVHGVSIPMGTVWDHPTITTQALITATTTATTASAFASVNWDNKTVNPAIGTTASDKADGDKIVDSQSTGAAINDEVAYTGLIGGKEYTLKGELMVKGEDGNPVATGITAQSTFTADATGNGTATVTFELTKEQLAEYAGRDLVAFEQVYLGSNTTPVAVHQDINDKGQTVTLTRINPVIGTTASDKADGDKIVDSQSTGAAINDEVAYTGLIGGKEYTLKGELMVKGEDGNPVATGITAQSTFTADATGNGTATVTFELTKEQLAEYAGRDLVAFEQVYLGSNTTPVAVHQDINDKGQTVTLTRINPVIGTTASDKADGDKIVDSQSTGAAINDEVAYTGLIGGKEYTLKGELMVKGEDGNPVATGITAQSTFTADATGNGTATVTFELTKEQLAEYAGRDLVAFEQVYLGSNTTPVAVHQDINDKGQTVNLTPAPITPNPTPTTPSTPNPTPTTPSTPNPTPTTPTTPSTPEPTKPSTPEPTKPAPSKPSTPEPTKPSTPEPTKPAPSKPSTPAPTPAKPTAPKPQKPETPTQTKPAGRMVTRTFQVDRYMPKNAAQARVVASLDNDSRLGYREDRPLWGASRWQFVTVSVPANATKAQVIKAINAKTTRAVGDVRTTAKLSTAKAGGSYVVAWELGRGAKASPKLAWGARKNVSQIFIARS
ncbi:VaFE repeat-containing surface-anchored protein [Gephyromycinifex aptenodytis]|uniref:VaFE repeat-containing surface-anchored protein n=1 Tax=Gephyromycinifex aptenodytis TaxID=2716227 RepID=UPI001444CDBA|nr:VaFE repeat-containing surface-anchored protein [Gephyromycinifex aptenodytis]